MTATSDLSKALDEAFLAALLLTGSTEVAENAVLDGVAAVNFDGAGDGVLVMETVQSAIHRRTGKPVPSCQDVSRLPFELRRLFLLAPTPRDCFVLRILLRASMAKCSELLNLTITLLKKASTPLCRNCLCLEMVVGNILKTRARGIPCAATIEMARKIAAALGHATSRGFLSDVAQDARSVLQGGE